ncbi:MAG TPA: pilus assembly protein PilZ [Anaeromyxobacteraceae bacterium]|nr:pilus assembly protein PilZ [Anaeromyxobacteraceae bacterium]
MKDNGRRLHSIALNLEAGQYLGGWRPEGGSLFLPALSESRVGDTVAIRLGIFGQSIRATIFGTITLVRRVGRPSLPPGVELSLDRASLPAASFLALAARGESVTFRERRPRYLFERRLPILRDRVERLAVTHNVSDEGCALAWEGPLPMVGEVLSIRLGTGLFGSTVRAVVCWNSLGGPIPRGFGLRVIAEGRAARAWKSFAAEAERQGVRAA